MNEGIARQLNEHPRKALNYESPAAFPLLYHYLKVKDRPNPVRRNKKLRDTFHEAIY